MWMNTKGINEQANIILLDNIYVITMTSIWQGWDE